MDFRRRHWMLLQWSKSVKIRVTVRAKPFNEQSPTIYMESKHFVCLLTIWRQYIVIHKQQRCLLINLVKRMPLAGGKLRCSFIEIHLKWISIYCFRRHLALWKLDIDQMSDENYPRKSHRNSKQPLCRIVQTVQLLQIVHWIRASLMPYDQQFESVSKQMDHRPLNVYQCKRRWKIVQFRFDGWRWKWLGLWPSWQVLWHDWDMFRSLLDCYSINDFHEFIPLLSQIDKVTSGKSFEIDYQTIFLTNNVRSYDYSDLVFPSSVPCVD